MTNDVKVVIELTKAAPRAGYGIPLIVYADNGENTTGAVPYKEVSSLEEVVAAGFAADTDVYKAAQLLFMQNDAPSTIAVCASETDVETILADIIDKGWRQLIVINDDVKSVSVAIETCGKPVLYFASVDSVSDLTAIKGNERTVAVVYKSNDVACPEAAVVGATAGLAVGSFTYKNIILKGVTAQDFTDSEVEDVHEAGGITILRKAGSIVTSEGVTLSGEYADIIDSKDYIIEQIEYQCQTLLNRVPKLPYDNRGIASLEGVVVSVLMDAANNGMIAVTEDGDYDYNVNFAPRSECPASDISARQYNGGQFTFALAGAVHNAKITGEVIA